MTEPAGVEVLAFTYTSQREMERIFTMLGVQLRVNDDLNSVEDCINEATAHFDFYLSPRYDPQKIHTNQWIRRNASWYACWLLSQRKGNPKQFQSRAEAIEKELEKIRLGRFHLPRAATRSDDRPKVQNLVVDHRRHVRQDRSKIVDVETIFPIHWW